MTSPPAVIRPGSVRTSLANVGIGTARVALFQTGAAGPLMVVALATTTAFAVTGVRGIPLAFLVVGAALAFFLVGYVAMARRIPNAGALYTYIARGLGAPFGVGAALCALLAYNALQISLYGGLGVVMASAATAWWGWHVAWWAWALAAWAIVAWCGVRSVKLNAYVLSVLLVIEVAVIVTFDIVFVSHPVGGHLTVGTLSPGYLFAVGWGSALVLSLTGYTGVEQAVNYSEEARRPERTIPRATYLVLVLTLVVYAGSAWAMSEATGPDQIVQQAQSQQNGLVFGLAARYLGAWVGTAASALLLTSLLASLIAFHNTCARYAFALGREHVLPGFFARTRTRSGSPVVGSVSQSLLALAVILVVAVAKLDPLVNLFFQLGMVGGFGAMILFTATSIAVVVFFVRVRRVDPAAVVPNLWRRAIAPAVGAAMLAIAVVLAVVNFADLLGVPGTSPWRWILPAVYLVLPAIGVGYAMWLKRARPDVYATVGFGSEAVNRSSAAGYLSPQPTMREAL